MSDGSTIEWTDASWNPVRGTAGRHVCARVSPGCDHCYAATMNRRFSGLDYAATGQPLLDQARLDRTALLLPARWRDARKVFVCSMTDLFGDWVPDEWIARVFAVMGASPRHTFQVLTKRPGRMRSLLRRWDVLPNVWLGVTIESDAYSWRANTLRQTYAAVRWVSAEPLLGPLPRLDLAGIDWLVVGGESGAGARPFNPDWARDLVRRARVTGTRVFVKQFGAKPVGFKLRDRKGGDWDEWPADLRIREFPALRHAAIPTRNTRA